MSRHPSVRRAPAGCDRRTAHREAPPQAARSALDAEHDGQADRRVKGPPTPVLASHPSVPSPAGRTARRAQGSRVPALEQTLMKSDQNNFYVDSTAQSLLEVAVDP